MVTINQFLKKQKNIWNSGRSLIGSDKYSGKAGWYPWAPLIAAKYRPYNSKNIQNGRRTEFSRTPATVLQLAPSPPQTLHLSSVALLPSIPSQPISRHSPSTQTWGSPSRTSQLVPSMTWIRSTLEKGEKQQNWLRPLGKQPSPQRVKGDFSALCTSVSFYVAG